MQIGIRCDAGGEYGLGHISRMTTLVKAMKHVNMDAVITFYSKTPALWMSEHSPVGCDVIRFSPNDSEMKIMNYIYTHAIDDILIIDRKDYYDAKQLTRMKENMKIVCIDMPWAKPNECDLLVIPNIHCAPNVLDQLDKLFGERLLAGKEYVLLQEDVLVTTPLAYKKRENWIAFFAGGSDPCNWMQRMYNMSEPLNDTLPNVARIYCIGQHAETLQIHQHSPNAWIKGFDLKTLGKCALAVSLFGVTVYEAMYLRTPTITTGHTKANEVGSQYLFVANEGATYHIPPIDNMMREEFCAYIEDIWNSLSLRKDMHDKSHGLIGDSGALNIAERILCLVP